MMTFRWQTLCLVPAGAGCRFRFAVLCSLSPPRDTMTNCKLKVEWTLSRCPFPLMRSSWCLSPGLSPPVCDLRRCPAQRGLWNWWSFCCFGKWGADNATIFDAATCVAFVSCLSSSAAASSSSLFFWLLINGTASAGYVVQPHELFALFFSFKAFCTHWKLIKH